MRRFFLALSISTINLLLIAQWTPLNNVPFVNHHSNGFGIDGKAYILQGEPQTSNGQRGNMMWEYTPESDTWEALGLAPTRAREIAIGDDMDGKYYFGFGSGTSDVWEFDPVTKEYKELPACPCESRGHPAFVAHNDKIFMGAGSGNGGDLKDWWIFDFATQTWEQQEDMPGSRRHHPYQFGIGDAIYVGGGHRGNWLKWDINTKTWSAINDFPGARVAGTQFSHDGKGFVLSGDTQSHEALRENSFLMYDPTGDQWYDLPFENTMHRWACSSFIIEDFIYYFGGIGYLDGGDDSNMWKFDLSSLSCLAPTRILTSNIKQTSVDLFWSAPIFGKIDHFQWRELDGDWNTVETEQSLYTLSGLAPCSNYEIRVHTDCDSDGEVYSEPEKFTTKGCGECIDNADSYCELTSFTGNGYLESVTINGYTNVSGDNDGYASFSNTDDVELGIGSEFELSINPRITSSADLFFAKVWIDFNNDSNFEEEELVLDEKEFNGEITRTLSLPNSALEGLSRLRIVFDVYSEIVGPCVDSGFLNGEVEDYCVTIVESITSSSSLMEQSLHVFPNPFMDVLQIDLSTSEDADLIQVRNMQGVNLISYRTGGNERMELAIGDLEMPKGIYIIQILNKGGEILFSQKIIKE